MAPIPNPHNGFVPYVGQMVMVIGGCHPRLLNRIVEVARLDWDPDIRDYHTSLVWFDSRDGYVSTHGFLGGLIPVRILE